MPSFSAINVVLHAITTSQTAIQVIEHNVANANTPGYHRQQAIVVSGPPATINGIRSIGIGSIGSGSVVEKIQRYSNDFFDARYRREIAEAKRWELNREIIKELESVLGETTDDSLINKLDAFFAGWQQLSTDPSSMALRQDLLDRARVLATGFNRRIEEIRSLRRDQDITIQARVDEINSLAEQVAQLNSEIARVKNMGDQPNDLLDQRDAILDRLSEISGATTYPQENGEVIVAIGGHWLVTGTRTFQLSTSRDPANDNLLKVNWVDNPPPPSAFSPTTGELRGLFDARDQLLTDQLNRLNTLAAQLITSVNNLNTSGYVLNGSVNAPVMFLGTNAEDIRVNDDPAGPFPNLSDLNNIGAAKAINAPGDGSNAIDLARLKDQLVMSGGTATFGQYYNFQVTSLGLSVRQATEFARDRKYVADAMKAQRDSLSGVSLDEEAVNLVKYQRAYQAAAKMMTVVDDLLDRVINYMIR